MEKLKKYEDEVDPSTKKKMKEDADSDVKNGKKHDSKAKALVMARVIVAANDKIDTPIPGLLAELAPLKAMKGVKNFEAEAKGNGKFEIYLIASKIKAGDYDIDPEHGDKENHNQEVLKGDDLTEFKNIRNQKIESVESEEMKNIIKQLYKDKGDNAAGKIIGDGSAMDALKNEIATGLPTNGIWHDDKLMQQKASLENLLNNKRVVTHDPITRRKLKKTEQYTIVLSAKDQSVARALIEEINTVLNQIPASGLNKKVL